MTELEKIEYTKAFIDKLANGINPLDDTPIPEGDIANNVRLSRCFFYVSDILRQVIENGGVTPPPQGSPRGEAGLHHHRGGQSRPADIRYPADRQRDRGLPQ